MGNRDQLLASMGRNAADPVSHGNMVDLVLVMADAVRAKSIDDDGELLELLGDLSSRITRIEERLDKLEQQS
ncbi:hypothetical protein N5923_18185 [Erwiniaceae bacterium BAC15a-03b]|uniref:Uncharacterized protein n=1 Tax=Winslowiella arboricola TaxID=2978220 RepID=A0A9J6PZI6_9GAMM|nr:hypothetical protein [Winslowiella arboricola]MCU5775734.1 hypothetical protein [Winslowiella arboricola]MCU5779415.1 hypothetical protein [Winslowiella arboricola]